jgi:hypothetical protein
MTKLTMRFLLGTILAVLVLGSVPLAQAEDCNPPPCGCCCGFTPGYWKNHTDVWPAPYTPNNTTLTSVFGANALPGTLLGALNFQGGPGDIGAKQILLRAAVASLLNAQGTTTFTCLTPGQVMAMVTAALNSGSRDTILALATLLDGYNQDCITSIS